MKTISKTFLIAMALLMSHNLPGQDCPVGAEYFQLGDFERATTEYANCLKELPNNPNLLYMNGLSLVRAQKYNLAESFLTKAKQANYQPTMAIDLNIAKCFAATGRKEQALSLIGEMVYNGFKGYRQFTSPEFNELVAYEEFGRLSERSYENAHPCYINENDRRFDFWIGNWDVVSNGIKVGDSSITRPEGGCAIHEDYRTTGIFAGQSMNFYNNESDKWMQIWVDSVGTKTIFTESDKPYKGDIQFMSEQVKTDGSVLTRRMTFTHNVEEDTVTQDIETSVDGGQTWTSAFVGIYKRK